MGSWSGGWATTGGAGGGSSLANTWLFVGDSLTEGSGGITTWVAKLTPFVPGGIAVSNVGHSGDTAQQILNQWSANKTPPPARVFVLGGTNNMLNGQTAASTFSTLNDIYANAKLLGSNVVAMTVPPFGNAALWTAGKQVQLEALNASILASANVNVAIDLYTVLGEPGTPEDFAAALVLADNIHPNDAGTTVMKNTVQTALGL